MSRWLPRRNDQTRPSAKTIIDPRWEGVAVNSRYTMHAAIPNVHIMSTIFELLVFLCINQAAVIKMKPIIVRGIRAMISCMFIVPKYICKVEKDARYDIGNSNYNNCQAE